MFAEKDDEALGYAREIDDSEQCDVLEIAKVFEKEPAPDELAGVEWTNGYYITHEE